MSPKRYRYTGKEKDEETGSITGGAVLRALVGRWTAADPAGFVDGINLYEYSSGNPARFSDPTGLGKSEQDLGAKMEATSQRFQNLANQRRAQAGKDPVNVQYQKSVGGEGPHGKGGTIPDELKTTPGTGVKAGHQQVAELKSRHVDSARNQAAAARRPTSKPASHRPGTNWRRSRTPERSPPRQRVRW